MVRSLKAPDWTTTVCGLYHDTRGVRLVIAFGIIWRLHRTRRACENNAGYAAIKVSGGKAPVQPPTRYANNMIKPFGDCSIITERSLFGERYPHTKTPG